MPLTKSFTTDYGPTAEYHVAEDVQLDSRNQTGTLTVRVYYDAAAYAAGSNHLGEFTIPIDSAGMYDSDDVWTKLAWSEVGNGKNQSQRETYLKGHKGKYGSKIVDYTTATGP